MYPLRPVVDAGSGRLEALFDDHDVVDTAAVLARGYKSAVAIYCSRWSVTAG